MEQFEVSVDNIMPDTDLTILITKAFFESLCEPIFDQIYAPLQQAIKDAGLTTE